MKKPRHESSWRGIALLFTVLFLAIVGPVIAAPTQVQASTLKNGLVQEGGETYYYKNGVKVTGEWANLEGGWRYFEPETGIMVRSDFVVTEKGNKYYQDAEGKRVFGWYDIGNYRHFFSRKNGAMKTGFIKDDGKRYYINRKTGRLYRNVIYRLGDNKMYWSGKDGALQTGFKTVEGKKYYFTEKGAVTGWNKVEQYYYYMDESGACVTGWQTFDGNKHYFIAEGPRVGVMLRAGVRKVGDKSYMFNKDGVMLYEVTGDSSVNNDTSSSGSGKTLKNFLRGALEPVGSTLYVWGGGHDDADATRIGVNPGWKNFYNSQPGSYDYRNYRFAYGKGVDCSGYVGWSIYQVMQKKSGGTNYTTLAEDVARTNAARGFGKVYTQATLSSSDYKFAPGDLGCTTGHTWIVLGQCSDKSLVIVHSTPPTVQISGTPTPDNDYNSEAIALARKYMKKYYSETVNKFGLSSSSALQYVKGCNVMRWNNETLKDPEGYRNMNAADILADLFNE